MSCQQALRLITTTTTNTSAATPEDPYVFTETVPTTPPILFNTQKSRSRNTDTPAFNTATAITATKTTPNSKLPLAQLNGNTNKTQASLAAATNNFIKNVTQSQKQQLQPQQQQQQYNNNRRVLTNVCVVRPQQQKQQQPPPLLQHTPSLWQTPLLLETVPAAVVVSPPTSPASLPCLPLPPPPPTTSPPAAAMVAPLISATSESSAAATAATLPPSNFHHTTLAQYLQKVQCIKKPKKAGTVVVDLPVGKASQQCDALQEPKVQSPALPPLQAFAVAAPPPQPQHSDSDLNEIPVNVIFRKPQISSAALLVADTEPAAATTHKQRVVAKQQPSTQTTAMVVNKPAANNSKNVKIVTPTATQHHLSPALNVLKDVVFVQPQIKRESLPPRLIQQKIEKSSMAHVAATPPKTVVTAAAAAHSGDTAALQSIPQFKTEPISVKITNKRKATAPVASSSIKLPTATPFAQKRNRKFFTLDSSSAASTCTTAVAVLKMSPAQVEADTMRLSSTTVLPYCLQQHWLNVYNDTKTTDEAAAETFNTRANCCVSVLSPNMGREERIAQHKSILRRKALQLLATRSLQQLPLQASRRRLLCVDRLLLKYQNHSALDDLQPAKKCVIQACANRALEMASHCLQHIANNAVQHIFLPCTAKFADNTQCRVPVFDITHDLPLCAEHARKRDAYNRIVYEQRPRKSPATLVLPLEQLHRHQHQQQQQQQLSEVRTFYSKKTVGGGGGIVKATTQARKRKSSVGVNPVGRPQKRAKKTTTALTTTNISSSPPPPPLSAVLQRKSSTTSLESIASNSHSSSSQQPHSLSSSQYVAVMTNSLAPPALAPLSGLNSTHHNHRMLNLNAAVISASGSFGCANDLKAHEINQIVAQFAMVPNNNITNNNNSSNSNYNYSHSHSNNNSHNTMNFMNTNSNSNFTTSGFGSSSSLPSTDELLTQDMLSICENSSAYASSEDTGLGGLSETELMSGAHDADEIPLGDTRLLEEHDLANVLSTLPEDAFNELFTAVHQDECDEVERALELADKHLKSLQQTIGSDSDFLGDFLDVNDEILADEDICGKMDVVSSAMHSPNGNTHSSHHMNTSTLFLEDGSSNAGGGCVGVGLNGAVSSSGQSATVSDIRKYLVQT